MMCCGNDVCSCTNHVQMHVHIEVVFSRVVMWHDACTDVGYDVQYVGMWVYYSCNEVVMMHEVRWFSCV